MSKGYSLQSAAQGQLMSIKSKRFLHIGGAAQVFHKLTQLLPHPRNQLYALARALNRRYSSWCNIDGNECAFLALCLPCSLGDIVHALIIEGEQKVDLRQAGVIGTNSSAVLIAQPASQRRWEEWWIMEQFIRS